MDRRSFVGVLGGLVASGRLDGSAFAQNLHRISRADEPVIGLNVHQEECLTSLPRLQELRVRHIRTSWWTFSRSDDWRWFPRYRDAGIEVMPLVYGGPEGRAAARYDALRRSYGPFRWVQLENEPDSEGANERRGYRFGRYLRDVADHIRQRDPGTRICSPGLGWTQPDVMGYLRGLVDGADGAFDALSIHIYGHHPWGEPLSRWRQVREVWSGELWSTELGQGSLSTRAYHKFRDVSRRELDDFQERAWRVALSEDPNRTGYDRIYGFHLGYDDGGFGILNADGSRRAAYRWLANRP